MNKVGRNRLFEGAEADDDDVRGQQNNVAKEASVVSSSSFAPAANDDKARLPCAVLVDLISDGEKYNMIFSCFLGG